MQHPYPSDSRCWHCDKKRVLTWCVDGGIGAWLCRACRVEAKSYRATA